MKANKSPVALPISLRRRVMQLLEFAWMAEAFGANEHQYNALKQIIIPEDFLSNSAIEQSKLEVDRQILNDMADESTRRQPNRVDMLLVKRSTNLR